MLRRVATALVAVVVHAAVASSSFAASVDVSCPPTAQACLIDVFDPGSAGSSTRPDASSPAPAPDVRVCRVPSSDRVVPCNDPLWGWFSNLDGCYYQTLSSQPDADSPIFDGYPDGGTVYHRECLFGGGGSSTSGWVVLPAAPDGFAAASVTPAELATRAVDTLELQGPDIGIAPPPGSTGLVGVPVWLWTDVSPQTWGPASATASIPGLSVTATAKATQVVWDMGDGTTITCANPGTAYSIDYGGVESPTCGHVYTRTSAGQPDNAYPITATTTWQVSWTGGGASGVLTVTRTSTSSIRMGELQVLVT